MGKDKYDERCDLLEYISEHHNEEDMRDVFLNMDIALKYIHEHNYCIEVFHPSKIEILEDMPDHIQFDNLMELSKDNIKKKDMIREDIYNSAFIQIGFYTNTLKSLTPEFLNENFDEVARFLPEGDIPYYRGVIQRGASVYFSEYVLEKTNRDIEQLEREIDGDNNRVLQKTNKTIGELDNDKINDKIYHQINGLRDVAFVSNLLVPALVILGIFLIGLFCWIISLI